MGPAVVAFGRWVRVRQLRQLEVTKVIARQRGTMNEHSWLRPNDGVTRLRLLSLKIDVCDLGLQRLPYNPKSSLTVNNGRPFSNRYGQRVDGMIMKKQINVLKKRQQSPGVGDVYYSMTARVYFAG